MDNLTLKLILTPTLIGIASLAGRRWGPTVSGWLVGLPFTSGPLLLFLALSHGLEFARVAAIGTLSGALSQAAFCIAYSRAARRWNWPLAFFTGALAFAIVTVLLQRSDLPLVGVSISVIAGVLLALQLSPGSANNTASLVVPPAWDIPARMILATGLVVLLSSLAPLLGAELTGLLAPFPVYAAILAVFAQQLQGPDAAASVLRGLLFGLFGFAAFFLVLASSLPVFGIVVAFTLAIILALLIQAGTLWVLQQHRA